MNYFYLFLSAGIIMVVLIIIYDIKNKKKVDDILRSNKNVPPLFMLRSAELKIVAIRSALNATGYTNIEAKNELRQQLENIETAYKSRELPLATYYAKLGALLISVNSIKSVSPIPEVEVPA